METPLYKLYLFKHTPLFHQTPREEMEAFRQKNNAARAAMGIRDLLCAEMAWSNEQWEYFGVSFYPNLETAQNYARCLSESGFYQYTTAESYLGIPMDNTYPDFVPCEEGPCPGAVYRVYLSRAAATGALISTEERAEILERQVDIVHMTGVKTVLAAYIRWNNELWDYFGVERFPDMETLIRYSQALSEIGWYRITTAVSYLGTARGGIVTGEPGS